jgi:hypothetical protein
MSPKEMEVIQMMEVGDIVQLSEATRREFLEHGGSGKHIEVARENRTGRVIQRVGTPGRQLVIGYLVDFDIAYFVVSEEGLILLEEKGKKEDPKLRDVGHLYAPSY